MFKLMVLGTSLLAIGAAPVAASPVGDGARASAACDAKYYSYLVSKRLDDARSIEGTNYRMITQGSDRGDVNPKRMTVVYDVKSNQIVEVGCG